MKLLTMSLAISIIVGLMAPDVDAQVSGKWVKLAPFPDPAEELFGVAAGGKMYVMGGLAPGWKPRGLVYEYDPAANQWTKKKPMALLFSSRGGNRTERQGLCFRWLHSPSVRPTGLGPYR